MRELLRDLTPAPQAAFHPFYQEFEGNLRRGPLSAVARVVFPATRYFVEARKPMPEPPASPGDVCPQRGASGAGGRAGLS
jgi:hypothetical protein